MNTIIVVTHKGLDYYKVEINGKEYEVPIVVGDHIAGTINALKHLIWGTKVE
jgi:hypothetical protein